MLLHQLNKFTKQILRVLRAGRSLGMILDRKQRESFMAQSFNGMIIQIGVNDLDLAGVEAFGIDAESVILRGDPDAALFLILDGMIGAVMAEFQFVRFPAKRETDDLIS